MKNHILLLLFIISTCTLHAQGDVITVYNNGDANDLVKVYENDAEATLRMYAHKDSLSLKYIDVGMYIRSMNGTKVALILHTGKPASLYAIKGEGLQKIGTSKSVINYGADLYLEYADVNFDGNTDLLLRAPTMGAHGNVECYNFIFDAEKKELLEVTPKYYENVVVDKQGKCVYSKSYGSACGTSNKAKYTFTGTSIDRAESVSFSADCLNESGRITTREGNNVTGVKVLPTKAAWAIFETSLWDTSKTWETDK